jgi:transposase-like protein
MMTEMRTKRVRAVVSEELKAAVLADLALLSPATVAAKYGLKASTVRGWKTQERGALVVAETDPSAIAQKKQRIQELMLEYLEASLNAQIAQAYVSADPTYINRQPAESLAILHGVLGDKFVRLVEAFQTGHTVE